MEKITEVIAVPSLQIDALYQNKEQGFALSELRGRRRTQEDAAYAAWYTPASFADLSVQEIGHRLWTSYHLLNQKVISELADGATASTTIYDGKGNLITATLADSVAFAVAYDSDAKVAAVVRLNQRVHHPSLPEEKLRVVRAGGEIINAFGSMRVAKRYLTGSLAVSRAIGDVDYPGVCADASIDVVSFAELEQQFGLDSTCISKIQIIATCDGFTEPAKNQSKEGHEEWLRTCLAEAPVGQSEAELAAFLTQYAFNAKSRDNISVAVQTLSAAQPCMLGVYDGHGGPLAAKYLAENIGPIVDAQCALSPKNYAKQSFSVQQRAVAYYRDNPEEQFKVSAELDANKRSLKLKKVREIIALISAKEKEFAQRSSLFTDEEDLYYEAQQAVKSICYFMRVLANQYEEQSINEQEFMAWAHYMLADEKPARPVPLIHGFDVFYLDIIRESAELLKEHRGWKALLINLLAACVSCLVGYALAMVLTRRLLVFQPTTDTGSKLSQLDEEIMRCEPGA